jgi:two-component system, cell cycle response regulator
MTTSELDLSLKPRVLIADDSRIVRATLIKQIQGIFDFCEAVDGEQAWEKLLLDPSIKVVITDLTMPKLDGYGLLQRIRTSKLNRVSTMPVIVVSGSDEQAERDRAKAAGANDLIVKGMATAQLLSRLDVLSKLVSTQGEYERSLEVLVDKGAKASPAQLASPYTLQTQAESMLSYAIKHNANFVLLNVCLRLRRVIDQQESLELPPHAVVNAIGQLLHGTIRHTDCVAKTAEAEFTVATGSISLDSAKAFAERLCNAVARAALIKDESANIIASCGLVSLCEYRRTELNRTPSLNALWDIAHRRGALGAGQGISGVVSVQEEEGMQQALI